MWGLVEGFTVDFGGSGSYYQSCKPGWFHWHIFKDKLPDMEPWTFRDSLVVLVDARAGLDTREVEFHHSTYWIQLHGILPFNMTTMVAQKIGSLVGKVLEVDQADGVECMGRFLQYEFLPEYCFVCGHLGHPSRIYIEKLEADQDLTESKVEVLHNFSGLEAVEDLSGWRLRFGERNVSQGNNSTSSGGRWRHERSSRLGEPRHLQQVGCWRDVGGAYMSRGWRWKTHCYLP
ncbi:unnamed protein product [Prunus armeniaca]|uniref:Uncharacterized protein n=1 Tax=Prunus armeniaca TaxID=36596 RepID=A0A6J5TFN9_PRUAR|nr:unnamed protein product [Prunus armeniaca]